MPLNLNNTDPINTTNPAHRDWLDNMQGNILSGQGRDHTVHLFLRFSGNSDSARQLVRELAGEYVTSALKQETDRRQFRDHKIPGGLFGAFFLSNFGYLALGFAQNDLNTRFTEAGGQPRPTASNFLEGMAAHAVADLGDPPQAQWDSGYNEGHIHAMLLLADDDRDFLLRKAREAIDFMSPRAEVVCVEHGHALRTDSGEGIEHFGYVDGRSQPLFLAAEFKNLQAGAVGNGTLESEGNGKVDVWNPFEPLKLVLIRDPMVQTEDRFGSYFVFRKLEQNVRAFTVAEQVLADTLGLKEEDRERAGAMAVGRFRDGTPLVLAQTDGFVPAKENNFRYDVNDPQGNKCPFHAHIRKTNPRGDIRALGAPEAAERDHRVARRGITYGERNRHPNAFQAIDDLPSKEVGLLFMCYQASIRNQFAFMQRGWANNQDFIPRPSPDPRVGLDPIIGQLDQDTPASPVHLPVPQQWKTEYGSPLPVKPATFDLFVKMKGGEFFFAPSLEFLRLAV